jgi:hypothetical protein
MKCEMDMKKLYVMAESAEEQKALNNLSEIMVGNDVFLNSGDDRAEVIGDDDVTPPVVPVVKKEEVTSETPAGDGVSEGSDEVAVVVDLLTCDLAVFTGAVKSFERPQLISSCNELEIEDIKGNRATTLVKKLIEWKKSQAESALEPQEAADATQTTEPAQEASTEEKAPEKPNAAESGETDGPPDRDAAMNAAREFIAVYGDPAFKKVLTKFNARTFSEVPEVSFAQFIAELDKQGEEEKANNA